MIDATHPAGGVDVRGQASSGGLDGDGDLLAEAPVEPGPLRGSAEVEVGGEDPAMVRAMTSSGPVPSVTITSIRAIFPVVTVPVMFSTTVSTSK